MQTVIKNPDNFPVLFDTEQVARAHFRASKSDFKKYGFLFDFSEKEILHRLETIKRGFSKGCFIGERQYGLLKAKFGDFNVLPRHENLGLQAQSHELILSTLDLHTANDLVGSLIQIRHALIEDSLFLGSLFGGQTLTELRQVLMLAESDLYGGISPRVSPMIEAQDMSGLMQRAGFALPVVDFERIKVSYSNIYDLMHDLRGMGESNTVCERSRRFVSGRFFDLANDYYRKLFPDKDGRIVATFDIIFVLGWSPSSSQPKPCERGSADQNLANFLEGSHFD